MSMKDLLNKMTELQGTTKEEKVTATGKKVLNESSNTTIYTNAKVINNKKGKPIGEVYPNGYGDYGYFHYKTDFGAEGMDSEEEAIEALNDHHMESLGNPRMGMVNETAKDSKPSLKSMFNSLLAEAEQVTIQPAQQNTQVIKQGDKTLGTVTNPNLAQQIKQSIGKGEMSLAGDELQEDDVSEGLEPEQKQRLNDLIDAYRDATDPDSVYYPNDRYDDYNDVYDDLTDPDVVIDLIRQEFGDKIADTVSQGPSMHYPRPGHVSGVYDPLANKSSPRVTKLGKINRQDAEFMKRNIKQQLGMNEAELNEVEDDYDGDDYDHDDGSDQYATELYGLHLGDVVKANYNGKTVIGKISELHPTYLEVELELTGRNEGKTVIVDVRETEYVDNLNEAKLTEKAKSKSQQQAAGAALAAKRGDAPKSKLKGASKEMAKMPAKELEKFASTKHKGLPDKKQKTDEALEKDGPKRGDINFKVPTGEKGKEYTANKAKQRADMNKKNDPGSAKKGLALSVVDQKKAVEKAKKKTNEAAMPTNDSNSGAGLGAGRNKTTLESSSMRLVKKDEQGNKSYKIYKDLEWGEFRVKFYENGKHLVNADYHTDDMQDAIGTAQSHFKMNESKKAKPDYLDLDKDGNKKESMKKAAADKQKVSTMKKTNEAKAKPDYIDLDKDGNKKESMKKAAADAKKKKTVKEGANPTEAARLLGKAHALAKDPFACKYESGTAEAQSYLDGYKEGLDECYGSGSMGDSGMSQMPAMVPGMDAMGMDQGFDDFEEDALIGGSTTFDAAGTDDYEDEMAFEDWNDDFAARPKDWKPTSGQAYDASKRALGIANRLPKDQRDKWNSRTMSQMNKFRAEKDKAFEAWDKELNSLLNEDTELNEGFDVGDQVIIDPRKKLGYAASGKTGKIVQVYTDSEGEEVAKIAVGGTSGTQTKMKWNSGMFGPKGMDVDLGKGVETGGTHTVMPLRYLKKQGVNEGVTVAINKDIENAPDSVTVTAQGDEADQLLAMIKQAGLGVFGGDDEQTGSYGAPAAPEADVFISQKSDIGDHDSMMALLQKMTAGSQDYEDEESGDDEHVHGHPAAACGDEPKPEMVMDEDESEDEMEFEVAEEADSEEAETTADEDAEAEEDKALAGADSGDEEELDESYDDSYPTINGKPVNIKSIEIEGGTVDDTADTYVTYAEFTDGTPLSDDELNELSNDSNLMSELKMNMYEGLNEWANDANNQRSEDDSYYDDIDFMTKVISGGLNNQKQDQTTLPHTKVTVDDLSDWKKLSGLK